MKTVHGEEAFKQKKHKRTDDNNQEKHFEEIKENISNTILFPNVGLSVNNSSNVFIENMNNDDDDEDVIVDQGMALNVDVLGENLGELSVGTAVHRAPLINSLKQITKKAVLPAIHITGVCEVNDDQLLSNPGLIENRFIQKFSIRIFSFRTPGIISSYSISSY